MRKYLPLVLLALLPFLMGAGAALFLQMRFDPVPKLIFRADSRSVILILSGLASLIILALVLVSRVSVDRCQRMIASFQQQFELTHRRFLRRLDHEVKNPLTAMRAALANLHESASAEERERAVTDLQHQLARLSHLVGDLRKLAELEERPLEFLPVDLNEVLTEVVDMARSQPGYAERDVHLVLPQVPWPVPKITGDRDLLWLVFYNLVDNALKYTQPHHRVEVRAFEDGHFVVVEVADNGLGIAETELERIFEELYRASSARGIEGSGLGLALAQRIAQRHGAVITVRSRAAEGGGTVFAVRLLQGKRAGKEE